MVIAVPRHRIACMVLPKAGCTVVKAAMATIDPGRDDPNPSDLVTQAHKTCPTRRFRPHRWNRYDGWWRFAVVRDPVERLMSVYTDRVVQKGDLCHSRKMQRGDFPDLPQEPDPDTFFQRLDEYVAASSSIRHHVLGAALFLGPDLTRYDRVYPIEEMPALMVELGRRTGRILPLRRANASRARLGLDDLAPSTRLALKPRLDREYSLLGMFYDNPLAGKRRQACVVRHASVS